MSKHRHFIVHKPFGYLSQFVYNQTTRKNKKLLGDLGDFPEGIMAIGRLDQHSEGLLLLTTDGMVSERIRNHGIEKEYYIEVDGVITNEALERLRNGVPIAHRKVVYQTLPCSAHRLEPAPSFPSSGHKKRGASHGPTSWLSVTITEGKYRQVRKMSAVVGFPVVRLMRVRIGDIRLGNLPAGAVVEKDHL